MSKKYMMFTFNHCIVIAIALTIFPKITCGQDPKPNWKTIDSTSIIFEWPEQNGWLYDIVAEGKDTTINSCYEGAKRIQSPYQVSHTSNGKKFEALTPYRLGLCAIDPEKRVGDPVVTSLLVTGPPAPMNVRSFDVRTNQVSISWEEYCDATTCDESILTSFCDVTYKAIDTKDNLQTLRIIAPLREATLHDLASNTDYSVTIMITTDFISDPDNGRRIYSDQSEEVIGTTLPAKAMRPTAEVISSSSIYLEWEEVVEGPATKTYTVSWISNQEANSVEGITTNSIQIDNLSPNTAVYFTVTAQNAAGFGEESEATVISTLITKPSSLFADQFGTAPAITIHWQEPIHGGGATILNGYVVSWTSQFGSGSMNVDKNSASVTIAGLFPTTSYSISVAAQGNDGELGDAAEIQAITKPGSPRFVSLVGGADPSNTVVVYWNKPNKGDAIDEYTLVWIARLSIDPPQDIVPHVNGTTTYSFIKTNLLPGVFYEVYVVAKSEAGTAKCTTLLYKTEYLV